MSTASQLTEALQDAGLPRPHPAFINTLLTSSRALPAMKALTATAKLRLLSSDFTSPNILDPSVRAFPANLTNPAVKELTLAGPIFVQVLAIEDLSKSRWEQIEAIEAVERGEATRGREVIRIVSAEDGEDGRPAATQVGGRPGGSANAKTGPHKLVLQDVKGQRVYGLELEAVSGLGLGMNIGSKIVLKSVVVARGMVLLQPGKIDLLGGKIEELHKAWLENRKKDLKTVMEAVAGVP